MLDGIISNMKSTNSLSRRSRSEILADLATLPPSIQGKISPFSVTTSSGNTITYHKLQYWANGRNHSIHIPNEKLAEFRAAVASGDRAWELLLELSKNDAEATKAEISPLKKSSRISSCGAPRRSTRS